MAGAGAGAGAGVDYYLPREAALERGRESDMFYCERAEFINPMHYNHPSICHQSHTTVQSSLPLTAHLSHFYSRYSAPSLELHRVHIPAKWSSNNHILCQIFSAMINGH